MDLNVRTELAMATISLPTPLRPLAGGHKEIQVNGDTVAQLLRHLMDEYPDLRRHIFTDEGSLRSFVNIYVNDEDIRYLNKEGTSVQNRDLVSIIPSIAGGV